MNDFVGIHEMINLKLNKLCMDESDPMVNVVVRYKHGILVDLQTSWSKSNSGRRFWSCPYYEKVDPRSNFIISRLVNKINELEEDLWLKDAQIDNLMREKKLNERWRRCRLDRKIFLCILICVAAMFINNKWTESSC
ncbi:hypothetical protein P3L10_030736 [Capsicum annuum]